MLDSLCLLIGSSVGPKYLFYDTTWQGRRDVYVCGREQRVESDQACAARQNFGALDRMSTGPDRFSHFQDFDGGVVT